MNQVLIDNKSDKLIVFLNGWGMDERPFSPLKSSSDVLFLSDYSDLSIDFDFSQYKNITLIAFSCGVFMASYLKEVLPKFDFKIAINGTIRLFDETYGISKEISKVFENISIENCLEFRKTKLLKTKAELQTFNKYQPHRSLESSRLEFEKLKEYSCKNTNPEYDYDKIISSKKDKIIPFKMQNEFWKNKVKPIEAAHFPFYNFKSFEEIINY